MKVTWHIAQQWCELGRVVRCVGWGMAVEHGSLTEKTSSAHSSLLSAEVLLCCWCLDASPLFRKEKGLSSCLSRTFEWVLITCAQLAVCVRERVSEFVSNVEYGSGDLAGCALCLVADTAVQVCLSGIYTQPATRSDSWSAQRETMLTAWILTPRPI